MVRYRLGVDIGGTFTDFGLIDDVSGKVSVNKCLTTPHDPSKVIMKGTMALLDREGLSASQLDIIVQGTTLATNALIERKGARTGLITPPVAFNLYVVKGVAPHISMEEVIKGALPYVGRDLLVVAILIIFPRITTWLPSLMR